MPNEATPLKGPAAATEDVSFFGTASWVRYGKVPGLISTMVLLCLGAVLDNADDTTLAGMLRAFEEAFGVSAYDESALLLGAGLGMALASPFWGLLADAHTRLYLISAGAAAWGLFTLLSAFATSFTWLIVSRTLTGVALAGILPIGQSLVADMFDADMRGRAFSVVQLVGSCGSFLGNPHPHPHPHPHLSMLTAHRSQLTAQRITLNAQRLRTPSLITLAAHRSPLPRAAPS